MAKKDLTARQRRFVFEYLLDLNATQAAKRAGYSGDNLDSVSCRLLKRPAVKAAINERMKRRERRTEVSQDRVLRELARVAFSDMDEFAHVEDTGHLRLIPRSERKPNSGRVIKKISETTTQFGGSQGLELHDKMKALELLGKHLGMFVERIGNPDGSPIQATQVVITLPSNGREIKKD